MTLRRAPAIASIMAAYASSPVFSTWMALAAVSVWWVILSPTFLSAENRLPKRPATTSSVTSKLGWASISWPAAERSAAIEPRRIRFMPAMA